MTEDSRHSYMLALTPTTMKNASYDAYYNMREDFHTSHSKNLVINDTCGTDIQFMD